MKAVRIIQTVFTSIGIIFLLIAAGIFLNSQASLANGTITSSFVDLWLLPMLFGIIGGVFFAVGFGMIMWGIKKSAAVKKLQESGRRIETEIKGVELNTHYRVNGRHPYRIISQFTEGNNIYIFKSDNIWFDPTNYIKTKTISVLVDPNNMKKYYTDISFLPKVN